MPNRTDPMPPTAILIPACNAAETIAEVVVSVVDYGTAIVIDDRSSDATPDIARRAGAHVISTGEHRGYAAALQTGFEEAARLGVEAVATLDADGRYDARVIGEVFTLLAERCHLVLGYRERTARTAEPVFARYARWRYGVRDILCGIKGYRIELFRNHGRFGATGSLGTALALFGLRRGAPFAQIEVEVHAPSQGTAQGAGGGRANLRLLRALARAMRSGLRAVGRRTGGNGLIHGLARLKGHPWSRQRTGQGRDRPDPPPTPARATELDPHVLRRRYLALAQFVHRFELPELDGRGRRILFNTVRPYPYIFHLYADFYLGYLLARCGCDVDLLLDDGVLEHWDTAQRYRADVLQWPSPNPMRDPRWKEVMQGHVRQLQRLFNAPSLCVHWYSELLRDAAPEAEDEQLRSYALSSALRFFESGRFTPEDPEQAEYLRRSLTNAQLSRGVARRALTLLEPDVFATSHAVYSTWGPAYSHARCNGVRTLVYDHHPYLNGGLLIDDAPGGVLDRQAAEYYLAHAPFDAEQRKLAANYLAARRRHETADTAEYYASSSPQRAAAPPPIAQPRQEHSCTFGVFPNVAWDALGAHLEPIYDGVVEWLVATIRRIGEQGRHRAIVRFHPAEDTRMKGAVKTEDTVRAQLPDLDRFENIAVIGAQDKRCSYELIKQEIDVCLVYASTMGGEAQMLGTPVVACAIGRFLDRFTHIMRDRTSYLSILDDPGRIIAHDAENRSTIEADVLKYHYYVSEALYYPLPILSRDRRSMADAEELGMRTRADMQALDKTLRRFIASSL